MAKVETEKTTRKNLAQDIENADDLSNWHNAVNAALYNLLGYNQPEPEEVEVTESKPSIPAVPKPNA